MSGRDARPPDKTTAKAEQDKRLAAALRQNLRRRKAAGEEPEAKQPESRDRDDAPERS